MMTGGNTTTTTGTTAATTTGGSGSCDSAAPHAVVQKLSRDLTMVQNRTYRRQAKPGVAVDVYQPSSDEDGDS